MWILCSTAGCCDCFFSHLFYIFAFLFGFWWHLQVKQKTEMLLGENRSRNGTYNLIFWLFEWKTKVYPFSFVDKKKTKIFSVFDWITISGRFSWWNGQQATHTYVYWHKTVKWIGRRSLETKSAPRKLINECCFSQTTTTHTNQQQKQKKNSEKIWILCLCVFFHKFYRIFRFFFVFLCLCPL